MTKQKIQNFLKMVSKIITFLNNLFKKIFSILVKFCKNCYYISVHFKNSFFTKIIKSPMLAFISLLYLITLFFSVMWIFEYKLVEMFQLIILFFFLIKCKECKNRVSKKILILGLYLCTFIIVCCYYSIFIDYLSVFMYKLLFGFIMGYILSNVIHKKYSKNELKSENEIHITRYENIYISVILGVIISVLLNAGFGFGFELINTVYCDNDDEIIVSDTIIDIKDDDKNYHFSLSKKFVKDGFDSVLKVLSESLPEIVGLMGGAKIGASLAGAKNSTLWRRSAVGVATAGAGAISLGVSGVVIQAIRKNNENVGGDDVIIQIPRASFEKLMKDETGELKNELLQKAAKKLVEYNKNESTNNSGNGTESGTSTGTSTGTGTGTSSENLNNAMDKVDLGGGDGGNFIPSLLDGNLSPLELLINCEIFINIMILIHIILLV